MTHPKGTGRTSLLSFSFSQTTVANLKLASPEHPRPQRAARAYCKRIDGCEHEIDEWIQSKADARAPEVKANRKLGNKGTSMPKSRRLPTPSGLSAPKKTPQRSEASPKQCTPSRHGPSRHPQCRCLENIGRHMRERWQTSMWGGYPRLQRGSIFHSQKGRGLTERLLNAITRTGTLWVYARTRTIVGGRFIFFN